MTKTDTHLRSLKGYDEPEILPSSTRQICLIGADAGQSKVTSLSKVAIFQRCLEILRPAGLASMLVHGEIAGDFIGSEHRLERVDDCGASSRRLRRCRSMTMRPFTLLSAKLAGIEGAGGDATGAFCAMTGAACPAAWVPGVPDEIAYPKTPSVSSRQAPGMSSRPSPGAPPHPGCVISSAWGDESGMAKLTNPCPSAMARASSRMASIASQKRSSSPFVSDSVGSARSPQAGLYLRSLPPKDDIAIGGVIWSFVQRP